MRHTTIAPSIVIVFALAATLAAKTTFSAVWKSPDAAKFGFGGQKVAAVIPAMIAKYGLEDRGVAIGHSSTGSLILRSLLADPRGDLDAAAVITQHLQGVGISGITTRLADERTDTDGGRPPNP